MPRNNITIAIKDLTVQTNQRTLFKNADFTISAPEKVGFIGRNGSGKTTLFELIYRHWEKGESPEYLDVSGRISISKEIILTYFPQKIQLMFTGKVKHYFAESSPAAKILRQFEESGQKSKGLLELMNKENIWSFAKRRNEIFEKLNISPLLEKSFDSISGGEVAKVALARIMMSDANMILLDEPTNNLDYKTLQFLTDWLKNWKGGIFIISHDRDFLDEITTRTLEIDEDSLSILNYGGNYSFYHEKKREKLAARMRQYEEEKEKRKSLSEEAKRLYSKAKEFETISKNSFRRARGAKIAKRANVQLRRIERDFSKTIKPIKPKRPSLIIPDVSGKKNLLVSLKNLFFCYENMKKNIISDISFSVYGGDRIGIIGPNGIGKSTILRLIVGTLLSQKGEIFRKSNLKIGYLSQYLDSGDSGKSIFDLIKKYRLEISEEKIRKSLGYLLFRNIKKGNLEELSLGELQRIQLFLMLINNPEVIILDEPTNHLDVYTLELLEEIFKNYNGAIITVSHDRRFLKNIKINYLYIFSKNDVITPYKIDNPDDIDKAFNLFL